MIGNDLVDLQLAKEQSNWQRRGFLQKLFSKEEQQYIKSVGNPFHCVWRLWSMKEAAYKVIVQQEQRRFFSPSKLVCTILSEQEGEVSYEARTILTFTTQSNGSIFTTTNKEIKPWIGLQMNSVQRLSRFAEKLGVPVLGLEVRKNKSGVPNLFFNNQQMTSSLSITHHGRFEAFQYQTL